MAKAGYESGLVWFNAAGTTVTFRHKIEKQQPSESELGMWSKNILMNFKLSN